MKQALRPLVLLFVILALGMKPSRLTSAAGDNCFYDCTGTICYNYGNHDYYCMQKRAECQAKCSAPNPSTNRAPSPPPPPKKISWGAIAYSPKDYGAGWSSGMDDRASAEKEALSKCSQRGKACVLETGFNKECGALAADGEFVGWGTSKAQRDAELRAVDECKQSGGKRCVIHISFCSL
jgi:hypothetical protein